MPDDPIAIGPKPAKPGHPAPTPQTDAGAYLADHLTVSKAEFARRLELGGKPWAVSRLINGNTPKEIRKYDRDAICDAAGMKMMHRREFLALLGVAYCATFPLANMAKYQHIDVEEIHSKVRMMDALVGQGNGAVVYPEARLTYDRLRKLDISRFDTEVIAAQIAVAKLMVEAQENRLAWTERAPTLIATYNTIQRDVFPMDRRESWASDFLWLCALRAVRYRENEDYLNELPQNSARLKRYTNTDAGFRIGAEYLHHIMDKPVERIAYRCQRVHALANQGSELLWRANLDTIHIDAAKGNASVEQRRLMLGLIDYFRAVGYKRLAWNLHGTPAMAHLRQAYASQSLRYIQSLSSDLAFFKDVYLAANQKQGTGLSFEQAWLLWRSTEAEATVWLNPMRTIQLGQALLPEAARWYPALTRKIQLAIAFAETIRE